MEDYSYLFDEFLEQTNDYDPPNSASGNFDICLLTYLRINNYGHDIITDTIIHKQFMTWTHNEHMINISIIR